MRQSNYFLLPMKSSFVLLFQIATLISLRPSINENTNFSWNTEVLWPSIHTHTKNKINITHYNSIEAKYKEKLKGLNLIFTFGEREFAETVVLYFLTWERGKVARVLRVRLLGFWGVIIFLFLFFIFYFLNIVLTWKIVVLAEASVLYIYIFLIFIIIIF